MIQRIVFLFLTGIFIFGSTVSMVGAEYNKSAQMQKNENGHERSDTVTQTIKITQDMKDWIGTHFDRKVKGEYLSVSEIEGQKGRFFLKVLSGNGKVLRQRVMKSGAETKEILKEINDGNLLINYIDKIIYGHSGGINKSRAYNSNRNGNKEAGQTTATTTGEQPGASQQQSPQSSAQADHNSSGTGKSALYGVWKGQYICGQGPSGLTLTISGDNQSKLRARFRFYGLPQNPSVPDGEFELQGTFNQTTGDIYFLPTQWINRPAGFQMVGMKGILGRGGQRITGTIQYPQCGKFNVSRVGERPAVQHVAKTDRGTGKSATPTSGVHPTRQKASQEIKTVSTAATTGEEPGASQQQSPQSKTHRETIANDTTESNKDKAPGKAQTNKPESKSTNTMPELVRKAEEGDADAQYSLGLRYHNGEGVTKNDAESVKWFRKAAEQGNEKAKRQLALLKKAGDADVNAKDNKGETPLHRAARKGKPEDIKALLDRGADIDAKDNFGKRPLHIAASSGKPEAIKVLLDRGADICAKDRNGWTASNHASERGNKAVIRLLSDAFSHKTKIASSPFTTECDRLAAHPDAPEGPFGPGYPGAIYLNAIYRGDHKQIAEHDHMFIEALINLLKPLQNHILLVQLLAGSGDVFGDSIREESIIGPLLGFFAVSYEHFYPQCMDSNPVIFKKTVQWDNVVTNGFGTELYRYPSATQTYSYRINQRHAAAFRRLGGDTSSPESIGILSLMYGNLIPQDMKKALTFLNDTMSGLRRATMENSCDSPLIQRLDKNMVEIFAAKYSRKSFISALATAESYTERLADFYISTYVLPQQLNDVQAIYTEMHNNGTSMQDAIRAISGSVCGGCFDQLTVRLHGIDAVHDGIDEMESIQITTADTVGILTESWIRYAHNLAKPVDHYVDMLQTKIADYQADGLSEQESCVRARVDLLGETDRDSGVPERMIPDFDKDPGLYKLSCILYETTLRKTIFDKHEAAFDTQDHQNLRHPCAAQPDGNSMALRDISKNIGQYDYFTVREEVQSKVR